MSSPLSSHSLSTHHSRPLHDHWQLAGTPADAFATPDAPAFNGLHWHAAIVPGTVAQAIHSDLNQPGPYDQQDWWYRTRFERPAEAGMRYRLRFEGLATLAEVWLNGALVLSSRNMFCVHVVDITEQLRDHNELLICFRSLSAALDQKRPRPRWKTALTHHQNLRWLRTTLLGRMPAWSPPINPVGPWRAIALETVRVVDIESLQLQTALQQATGITTIRASMTGAAISHAELIVGEHRQALDIANDANSHTVAGSLEIADVPLWWPHTHGRPMLLPCHLELTTADGLVRADLGRIGFKSIVVDRSDGKVQFVVNGAPVFCRGACWTTNDILSLSGSEEALRQALQLARDANMNMLRIGGTMHYETPRFFELCDELGIMVWQDFMFANMDYPVDDPDFAATIDTEVRQQLNQLQSHPCIAVYCAGSEIEQQAAMMGMPAEAWTNAFFSETLPQLCATLHAGIPYFRGSPSEGALPFHVAEGVAHYYGVGAYRRPLDDVKHAGVKFASECLGISNVPEPETVALLLDGITPVPHHPRWKARVPRDSGSGYDFEDIRDFYLQALYGLDPVRLRSEDTERYYAISRAVSGEVMLRTYAEWRRADNACNGGLIWFYKDLWPGAGWGVIDSENRPKAAWHYLQRALAPRAVLLTDDGLEGIKAHVFNENADVLQGELEVIYLQHGKIRTLHKTVPVSVPPRASVTWSMEAIAGYFTDSSYAYKFGPPKHDAVVARLRVDTSPAEIIEDIYFPLGLSLPYWANGGEIQARAAQLAGDKIEVTVSSTCLLHNVSLSAAGYVPERNYFHVVPGRDYRIAFKPIQIPAKKFKAYLDALNLHEPLTLRLESGAQ